MKVGVTGASGHIGNVLCRYLLDCDYKVKALYNKDKRGLEDLEVEKYFETFQGDVLNLTSIIEFTKERDLIINCAAIISIYGDPSGIVFRTNTQGTENIIEACI